MESISEVSEEKEPVEDGKPSLTYWKSQLAAYDEAARSWKKDVDAAFDEYLNKDGRGRAGETKKGSTHFPLFWSCVRTIQPAFYSRTPVIVTEKAFKELRDNIARLGAICLERLGKYATKTSGFDRTMSIAVTHFIMAEKASVRAIFESDVTESRTTYERRDETVEGPNYQIMNQTALYAPNGERYEGEYEEDEEGNAFSVDYDIKHLACVTEPLHYRDYRHNANARYDAEIDWMSFDTQVTRTEVERMFGKETAEKLTYSPAGSGQDGESSKPIKGQPALFATITEIWDRKKRKVYYLSPGCNEWLINVANPEGEDPYKLKDFFPCPPFVLGTHGPDDMFTAPAYVQLKDFIEQVHGAFDRVRRLILALKKAGVFDSSKPELAELNAIASEGQFIGVADLESLLGPNGTLEKLIHFFPTDKIAQGVNELKTAMMEFEQKLYDLWGIPDIYRGITDPNETLGAQQLKGKHMSVRFSVLQREIQRLARDLIEIMCDLYLAKCPDFKLAEIMGVKYMTPEEQQLFPEVLAFLKSDSERCLRLEIETDSTITQNLNADIEQKQFLGKTMLDGLSAVATASQQDPTYGLAAMKVLGVVMKSLQQGKLMEEDMDQLFDAMSQRLQAQAQQPPPPNPEVMKAQAHAQALQMKMQADIALEQQKAQAQIAVEQRQTEADIVREDRRAQAKIAADQALTQAKAELERFKAQIQMAADQQKAQLDAELQMRKLAMDQQLQEQQAKLNLMSTALEASLKKAEEQRALKETQQGAKEAYTQAPPQSPPVIHVHTGDGGKPKGRKMRIKHDDGTSSEIEEVFTPIGDEAVK